MGLANVNSKLGLVNGSQGIASGVIIEPDAKFFKITGRLSTSQGPHLLKRLDWADIQKLKPLPELISEMARLQDLQRQASARWQAQID